MVLGNCSNFSTTDCTAHPEVLLLRGLVFITNFGQRFSCIYTENVTLYELNATSLYADEREGEPLWLSGFEWRQGYVIQSIGFQWTWELAKRTFFF